MKEEYTKENLYNDKIKALRKAILGWIIIWLYILTVYFAFGTVSFQVAISLAIFYDLALHIATLQKDPYERKWGWVFYPVIFQRDEDIRLFDFRYHLFWIPYWLTVFILVLVYFIFPFISFK